MPFYFRKSVTAGPFRFNFSKGGIGASVGVNGFRIGSGPRGHYVHAGRGGIYYRASLGEGRRKPRTEGQLEVSPIHAPRQPAPSYAEPDVEMVRVSSGDVLEMQDERFSDLLEELNAKQGKWSSAWLFALFGLVAGAVLAASIAASLAPNASIAGALPFAGIAMGVALGKWRDTYARSAVLFYELEDDAHVAYVALTNAFDQLAACRGKWHVDSGGAVQDLHAWKRNAGASHLIDRRPTIFNYALPSVLKCNITPPALKVGKETLLLLPDVMLVIDKEKVGAVSYDALTIRCQDTNFVEEGIVPADSQVISHTWKHPNKRGGPDRRFRDNRQLPVCRYESIYLTSSNGLNELLQVSRTGVTQPIIRAIQQLARTTGPTAAQLVLPRL